MRSNHLATYRRETQRPSKCRTIPGFASVLTSSAPLAPTQQRADHNPTVREFKPAVAFESKV
jgi:hypothetical protein